MTITKQLTLFQINFKEHSPGEKPNPDWCLSEEGLECYRNIDSVERIEHSFYKEIAAIFDFIQGEWKLSILFAKPDAPIVATRQSDGFAVHCSASASHCRLNDGFVIHCSVSGSHWRFSYMPPKEAARRFNGSWSCNSLRAKKPSTIYKEIVNKIIFPANSTHEEALAYIKSQDLAKANRIQLTEKVCSLFRPLYPDSVRSCLMNDRRIDYSPTATKAPVEIIIDGGSSVVLKINIRDDYELLNKLAEILNKS